jgi:hypothetical protein
LELEQVLVDVLASPQAVGRLEAIVVRPAKDVRRRLTSTWLTPENGIDGDRWARDSYYKLADGTPDPRSQLSLMNFRFLRQISSNEEDLCLAGDNLLVDLDLGESNLPTGSRLAIGETAVIEINELPHTGCSRFAHRYGDAARAFINNKIREGLHLRGRFARIIIGGTVAVGDPVRKISVD